MAANHIKKNTVVDGSPEAASSLPETLTREETADYIADLARELARIARSAGLVEAANLLSDAARLSSTR